MPSGGRVQSKPKWIKGGGIGRDSDVTPACDVDPTSTPPRERRVNPREMFALRRASKIALERAGAMHATALSRAAAYSTDKSAPLLVTMIGVQKPLNEVHRMIEASGAEIKESRNVRLGGRASNMFLVTNADPMLLKKEFEGSAYDFFSIFPARNTVQDLKGPYCETSPLLPYVRRAKLSVPYKKGVVNEIADFLCCKGITLSHLDEYRSGRDVVLECIMHLPTGLAEFPVVDDARVVAKLESLGVTISEFGRVEGRPREENAAKA